MEHKSTNSWQAGATWVVRDSNGILRGQEALQLMTSSATAAEFEELVASQ